MMPPPGKVWSELLMPHEYPLAFFEMSFLLPHFLKEGRGKLAMYFTRVYNPVWTNPDGMSWIEMLTDEAKVERHACLTPIWSETAWFADYVLPMGHASERHDLMSQETHAARWIGFRQPVLRVALEKQGKTFDCTWQAHEAAGLGQVWEEDEFWIELSWRIDPDGALGIRKYFESPYRPGEKLRIEEFYRWIFEHSVPGLPAAAEREGLTPARLHAQVRGVPRRGQRVRDPRDRAHRHRARGRGGRSRLAPGDEGRRLGRGRGRRAVPDVAMDGDPNTGMLLGLTQQFPNGVAYDEARAGGTSMSTPLFAAVQALTSEAQHTRLGFANPRIYALAGEQYAGTSSRPAAFRDVTAEHDGAAVVRTDYVNGVSPADGLTYSLRSFDDDTSLQTTTGWDDVTGVGSPSPAYYTATGG